MPWQSLPGPLVLRPSRPRRHRGISVGQEGAHGAACPSAPCHCCPGTGCRLRPHPGQQNHRGALSQGGLGSRRGLSSPGHPEAGGQRGAESREPEPRGLCGCLASSKGTSTAGGKKSDANFRRARAGRASSPHGAPATLRAMGLGPSSSLDTTSHAGRRDPCGLERYLTAPPTGHSGEGLHATAPSLHPSLHPAVPIRPRKQTIILPGAKGREGAWTEQSPAAGGRLAPPEYPLRGWGWALEDF